MNREETEAYLSGPALGDTGASTNKNVGASLDSSGFRFQGQQSGLFVGLDGSSGALTSSVANSAAASSSSISGSRFPSSSSSTRDSPFHASNVSAASTSSIANMEEGLQETDVICARDKFSNKHTGNLRYQAIVRAHREAYQGSKLNEEKSTMTRSVIQKVKEFGGRFVKFNKKTRRWEEISAAAEHDKVSHALRSSTKEETHTGNRRKKSPMRSHKSSTSSTTSVPSLDSGSAGSAFLDQHPEMKLVFSQQQKLFESMKSQDTKQPNTEQFNIASSGLIDEIISHPVDGYDDESLANHGAHTEGSTSSVYDEQSNDQQNESLAERTARNDSLLTKQISEMSLTPIPLSSSDAARESMSDAIQNARTSMSDAIEHLLAGNSGDDRDSNEGEQFHDARETQADVDATGESTISSTQTMGPPHRGMSHKQSSGRSTFSNARSSGVSLMSKQSSDMSLTPIPLDSASARETIRFSFTSMLQSLDNIDEKQGGDNGTTPAAHHGNGLPDIQEPNLSDPHLQSLASISSVASKQEQYRQQGDQTLGNDAGHRAPGHLHSTPNQTGVPTSLSQDMLSSAMFESLDTVGAEVMEELAKNADWSANQLDQPNPEQK
eukprot:CAMPEP_0172460176 /NCGR_PEP_ID=MMETSP1065-20121228/35832_1 /TAXON_ID=265537 /ORGANISM="Amphiprora paludosa, Strain CCMP125" /LENGTH=607 /DNA_ID=CAMNT_0013215129 /DNA_START=48 /DNA_END=1871 /DNA_ORIENTATION=-